MFINLFEINKFKELSQGRFSINIKHSQCNHDLSFSVGKHLIL